MNNMTIENETAAATTADNSLSTVKAKGKPGRPRTNLTCEVVFLQKSDGSVVRRGKGKPAHDSKAMVYSVAYDYEGTVLPENAVFLRLAEIKDTRKQANPVVPTVAEILPTIAV